MESHTINKCERVDKYSIDQNCVLTENRLLFTLFGIVYLLKTDYIILINWYLEEQFAGTEIL